jgi:hypothetical protein
MAGRRPTANVISFAVLIVVCAFTAIVSIGIPIVAGEGYSGDGYGYGAGLLVIAATIIVRLIGEARYRRQVDSLAALNWILIGGMGFWNVVIIAQFLAVRLSL